jgi:uncharacterized membrane protein YfcA
VIADPVLLGAVLILTGALAGILAGLLGVGGGIVIVPVLYNVLGAFDVPEALRMHVAVGTSLATIIPTAIVSARAHARRGAVYAPLVRAWGPAIALGTVIGTIAANLLNGRALAGVFGVIALLVAADLVWRRNTTAGEVHETQFPPVPVQHGVAAMIGFLSAMMGIGGGTLTVPVLNWFRFPIHRAVATSSVFGLIIAVPAALGYVWGGLGHSDLPPGNLGYVSGPGFALIAAATFVTAPYGTRIAHAISPRSLRLVFAAFLAATSFRMLSGL